MSNLNRYTAFLYFFIFIIQLFFLKKKKAIKPLISNILINVYLGLRQFTLDTYTSLHMVEREANGGIPTLTPSALKRSSLKCVNSVEELWSNTFHNR